MKILTIAAAVFAFATAASACPFGMTSQKTAEAPIELPTDNAGS